MVVYVAMEERKRRVAISRSRRFSRWRSGANNERLLRARRPRAPRLHAARMSHGDDAMSTEAQYRDGAPQEDVVLRYLDILRAKDRRELDAGFAAILTDFVSTGPGRLRSLSRVLRGQGRGRRRHAGRGVDPPTGARRIAGVFCTAG